MPNRESIRVERLAKTFRTPWSGKRIEAVRNLSFVVESGEIFGFLGPNGSGKTTTLKMLTGLIAPSSGTISLFGSPPSPQVRAQIGFLPEQPYIFGYITPREYITLCGQLSGLPRGELGDRVIAICQRVDMTRAIDRPAHTLSKGMLQRVAIAAALVHEPSLLLLDEPMSGLDPVGRKEVRDLILEEKQKGRTVFFSSHILSDVEMLCDRICILRKGEMVVSGGLSELIESRSDRLEVSFDRVSDQLQDELTHLGGLLHRVGDRIVLEVDLEQGQALIQCALERGARLVGASKRQTLERLFMDRTAL